MALVLVGIAPLVHAQDASPTSAPSISPSPTPETAKLVAIRFVPPPLEGTISLGIYDSSGQLVRVLFREAGFDELEVGSDALSTTWDGKNDRGEMLPPGKYHARGFVVGELAVEGVGFFFNDWVTDEESPHLRAVENLKVVGENELALLVTLPGKVEGSVNCDLNGELTGPVETEREDERFLPQRYSVQAAEGKISFQRGAGWESVAWPDLIAPQSAAAGKDGTVWVIDRAQPSEDGLALKQFSPEGAFLRQMLFPLSDPQPKIVAASTTSDQVFLLEENAAMQRVRGLRLVATVPPADPAQKPISDWKVEFEKQIVAHARFAIAGGRPVIGPDPAELDKITVQLRANPLEKDQRASVDLMIGYDREGSFLKTADGLPLQTVSETQHLTRVILARHGEKSIDVFQDDEAVVEQFCVTALDQMMAFDGGQIELK